MICRLCKQEKQLDEFVKDKRRENGVRDVCKRCENKRRRKTTKPEPKEGNKICAMCKVEKSLDNFNIRKIAGKYRPFSYCKSCERLNNNNRYKHICIECGNEYKSGRKNSKLCKICYSKKLGELGKANLEKHNKNQFGENNYFYGSKRTGESNPNYNKEKTDEEREAQRIVEGYAEWRQNVYERDKYICVICGYKKGGILNAHHLDGYNWCKEKRTDVENGVTLCEDCHNEFHKIYGSGNNTRSQFEEFTNLKSNMLIPR